MSRGEVHTNILQQSWSGQSYLHWSALSCFDYISPPLCTQLPPPSAASNEIKALCRPSDCLKDLDNIIANATVLVQRQSQSQVVKLWPKSLKQPAVDSRLCPTCGNDFSYLSSPWRTSYTSWKDLEVKIS